VDQSRVKATHKDGVLEVVLTKSEETHPRQIRVEIK
jgi:HSP20 family molecular chaperone IbpA